MKTPDDSKVVGNFLKGAEAAGKFLASGSAVRHVASLKPS